MFFFFSFLTFGLTLEIASLVASYERQRRATCNIRTTILHLELSVEWPLLDTPPPQCPYASACCDNCINYACGTGFCQIVATFADTQLVEDREGGREDGGAGDDNSNSSSQAEGEGRVRECCACRTSKQNRIGIRIGAAAWHGICCIVWSPQAKTRRRRSRSRRLPTLFAYPITEQGRGVQAEGGSLESNANLDKNKRTRAR